MSQNSGSDRPASLPSSAGNEARGVVADPSSLPIANGKSSAADTPTEGTGWDSTLLDATLPEQIGPYRILSRIGEGGIGIVYKAEQREPVKRVVALKIIKLGMDTREVVQRFSAERQALAMMDHPNVARVFDAGSTPTGRPYFVMELVAGEPITDYCDRHSLTVRQRLELFLQICAAVHHAHQKGIIHRDLKPTNILVAVKDGAALAKVIDFGIAKAISTRLTDNTLYTEQGQLIGTPEYMSPEQAEMSATDIDARSDIYSLGVMLYELLAGAPPVDSKTLRRHAYAEIQRIIREVEPPPPSIMFTRLGADAARVAGHRRVTALALAAELKRELEWIPLKAMRKDRTERYQTARDLAADIQNYLSGLPLSAGPETIMYRTKKFVRRNRVPVTVAALFVGLVLASVMVSFVLWRSAVDERSRNDQERVRLVALKDAAEKDRAEAERMRNEAQKEREVAMAALSEMATNIRNATELSPETRQQLLTNGILAVVSKDPAFVASMIKQMSEGVDARRASRAPPPTATRPARTPGTLRPPGGNR